MTISTIDIETMPDVTRIKDLPPARAKYGNTKDPEKRAAMDKVAVVEQVGKMALDPLFGNIASYAVVQDGECVDVQCVSDDFPERELLDRCLQWLRLGNKNQPHLCTWNGTYFDIPFLYKRAMYLDFIAVDGDKAKVLTNNLPSMKYYTKRYDTATHIDIPQIWMQWDSQARYLGLNTLAGPLLGENKIDFDVTTIPAMVKSESGRKLLKRYNEKDVLLTDKICHLMEHILF